MDGYLLLLCMPHCYLDIVQDYCHFFFLGGGSPKIVCTIVGGLAKIVLIRTRGEGGQKTRFLPVRTIWMFPYMTDLF